MDEELRTRMVTALVSGDYPEALQLSQELDKQIVEEQLRKKYLKEVYS